MTYAAEKSGLLALKLAGTGPFGEALAQHDVRRVSVFGGIPGEDVLAGVVRQRRKRILARVVEVTNASPERVEPPCPYFVSCTGCQWQHIRYEYQLELKRGIVQEAMQEAGIPVSLVSPVVPAPQMFGYRNHMRFTVGPGGNLGFVNWQSRRFVSVNQCLLMHPWINQALSQLQGRCGETTQVSIRYGVNTGQWLIQPTLSSSQVSLQSGQKHYEEALAGRRFRISAASFFQVNTVQAEHVAQLVRQRLGLTGRELVVDAYAGVGTFAVLLAPFARKVIAIEEAPSAIRDAQINIQGLDNVEVVEAKTEHLLGVLPERPDALVLDPPRSGCQFQALQAVLFRPPQRVVYVSCNPQALARDLRILLHGPLVLEEVLPIDLFPQTHHVECLATLSYNPEKEQAFQSRQQLILASGSPRRQEIMAEMGLSFRVVPPQVAETASLSTDPVAVARERALQKARSVASMVREGMVIGADTVVADGDVILEKPASEEEAHAFLRRLRGKEHRVITGLALIDAASGEEVTGRCISRVLMREYSDAEIAAYVASGDAWDKAGGYAIQDKQFHPVAQVTGCYLNVVGLPVCTLLRLMRRMGVYPTLDRRWVPPGDCPDCHRLARQAQRK
ncbi:MAG: septum formation protein Maf [Chloroflexi bacterium]|nr:septum formation protein Maf [Chloroflexota bacterium]